MEEELTCPVCLELFEDPVFLPCSHNLCRRCVERLADNDKSGKAQQRITQFLPYAPRGGVSAATASTSVPKRTFMSFIIRCPTCRRKVHIGQSGIDKFPRNLTLRNIVNRFKSAPSNDSMVYGRENECERQSSQTSVKSSGSSTATSTSSQDSTGKNQGEDSLCDVCCDSKDYKNSRTASKAAEKFCRQCNMKFCGDCLQRCHPAKGAYSRHDVSPVVCFDDLTPKCSLHPSERMRLFCMDCNVTVCTMCVVVGEHKGHNPLDLPSARAEKKMELRKMLTDIEATRQEMADRAENLDEKSDCLQMDEALALQTLHQQFDNLVSRVRDKEKEMERQLCQEAAGKLRVLNQKKVEADRFVAETVQAEMKIQEVLKNESATSFLMEVQTVLPTLMKMMENKPKCDLPANAGSLSRSVPDLSVCVNLNGLCLKDAH